MELHNALPMPSNENHNDSDLNANQNGYISDSNDLFPTYGQEKYNSISTEKSASTSLNEKVEESIMVTLKLGTSEISNSNRGIPLKRKAKLNLTKNKSKMICKRKEKPIDEMLKSLVSDVNCINKPQSPALMNSLQIKSPGPVKQMSVGSNVADQLRINQLEKQNAELISYQTKERDNLIKILIESSKRERELNKLKVHNDRLQLGDYITVRHGVHYEQKFIPGLKFEEIEKKRKLIEKQREENEKKRKMLNKSKPIGDKSKIIKNRIMPELDPYEFFIQSEKIDIIKGKLNKEEKDLENELESLTRIRNSHLREMKRIENEESSRFRDFPILHERYLVLSLLGKGGFSEVYKAFDLEHQIFVACKFHELNPNWSNEKKDSYIKHGLREIHIQKSLDHPRIVGVLEVFNVDNDTFVMVLEYCDGNDLDFYLKQNKCLPERDTKLLIAQLVTAVNYLNDRRTPIIHYDLKPGNILISNGDIKVTDFGLSKIFPDNNNNPDGIELTSQGAGTYWYLPPECFVIDDGPQIIDNKVDVWSIGVIFYQCLYGKKPFGNEESQTDILKNNTIRLAKSITFPLNPKVSEAAKDFIRKCLTYSRQDRPNIFQLHADEYLKPKI